MNPDQTDLPYLQITKFEYDEVKQELSVEIAPDPTLYEYVGQELKLNRPSTHEEMETFYVEIIAKALQRQDGFNINTSENV